MERIATCACSQLSIKTSGEPSVVAACNCIQCQKRTGSVFGVSSYFHDSQIVEQSGERVACSRTADSGLNLEGYFCPSCGTTVFWKAEFFEGHTGIAVGCFADPTFPAPTASVWSASKHDWVSFPAHCAHSENQEL